LNKKQGLIEGTLKQNRRIKMEKEDVLEIKFIPVWDRWA
jgi:hypothetical protein